MDKKILVFIEHRPILNDVQESLQIAFGDELKCEIFSDFRNKGKVSSNKISFDNELKRAKGEIDKNSDQYAVAFIEVGNATIQSLKLIKHLQDSYPRITIILKTIPLSKSDFKNSMRHIANPENVVIDLDRVVYSHSHYSIEEMAGLIALSYEQAVRRQEK